MTERPPSTGSPDGTLLIAHRTEAVDRLRHVGASSEGGSVHLVTVAPFSPPAGGGEEWISSNQYVDDDALVEALREAVDWLKAAAHQRLGGGDSLVKALEMDDVSLWWFVEAPFFRSCFKNVVYMVAWLQVALERIGPARVVYLDDGSIIAASIRCVCRATGTPAVAVSHRRRWGRLSRLGPGSWLVDGLVRAARDRLRGLVSSVLPGRSVASPGAPDKARVLLASMAREEITFDPSSGRRVHADLMLGPLVRRMADDPDIAATLLYKFPYPWRFAVPKDIRSTSMEVVTWESLANRRSRRLVRERVRRNRRLRKSLWASADFAQLWTYRGVDVWPLVSGPLGKLWKRELALAATYLVQAGDAIESASPDVLLVAGETSADNKALVAQAKRLHVPTVAIQHGNIIPADDYLVDYRTSEEDLVGVPTKATLFPDRLCVSGPETIDVLARQIGYPFSGRLVVTGQARMDPLIEPEMHFDREKLRAAFKIERDKKVVLIGSQTFHIAGNRVVFMSSVLESLKREGDIVIVVKPHPLESARWHRRFARKVGVQVVVLPQNLSGKAALFASDVLVTFYSTIATEAVLQGLPVILVNLTGRPAPVDYSDHGWVTEVLDQEAILPAVRRAIEDESAREWRRGEARRHLREGSLDWDGRATQRITQIVREMCDVSADSGRNTATGSTFVQHGGR